MITDTDSFAVDGPPQFLEQTERLKVTFQGISPKELQAFWECNDAIAKLNVNRLEQMDLRRNLTPAVMAYVGIQYRYMAPGVMETAHLDYLWEHLPTSVQFITCMFGEWKDGKIIEKGTQCKMAQGEMVRWLAERNITDASAVQAFDQLDYQFQPSLSTEDHKVFLKADLYKHHPQ